MIFDTHCHPHLNKEKDCEKTISDFFIKWWKYLNIIWTSPETNSKVIELANKYDWVFCSIWIHPCDVYDLDLEKAILWMENQILKNRNKIIAIWECWLDYYWFSKDEKINNLDEDLKIKAINSKKELQKIFFKAQILLAKEYNLPIIIHNRDSREDVLEIIKEMDFKNFIFHCYSEDLEYAKKLIDFAPDCKISFSWIVTFKSAKDIQDTAKNIDIKNIIAETDSPYLTPTPFRWKEENEPYYTKYVVDFISELRWENCEEKIFNNSIDFFKIKRN